MTSDRCGSIAAPFPTVERWQRKYVVGNYLTDALQITAASNVDARFRHNERGEEKLAASWIAIEKVSDAFPNLFWDATSFRKLRMTYYIGIYFR